MELVRATDSELQAIGGWDAQQLSVIKSQIAPNCSDAELMLFGQVCQRTGLDPFARQIYAISRKSKDSNGNWVDKMTIQTSIDGYRLIADRTGKYGGSETFWCGEDEKWFDVWLADKPPAAAKTVVYRAGSNLPFTGVAKFRSYAQTTKSGDLTSMWAKMPEVLIGKCSEANALRRAFPAELSGLYTKDEMMQADIEPVVQSAPVDAQRTALESESMQLLKALGWSRAQGSARLMEHYDKATRKELTDDELKDFIGFLRSSTEAATPVDVAIVE